MSDTNNTEEQVEGGYGIEWIPLTDLVWGRGFIAPGGEANVARINGAIDETKTGNCVIACADEFMSTFNDRFAVSRYCIRPGSGS